MSRVSPRATPDRGINSPGVCDARRYAGPSSSAPSANQCRRRLSHAGRFHRLSSDGEGRTERGGDTSGADRAEVRRLVGRRRRADQARGRTDRRRTQGRRRRGGGRVGDGRHHRRTARPRPPGQPAAARARAGHAAHRGRADLDGAAGDGDPQPGLEARSYTGSQAGVITTSSHGRARIIDVTPGRLKAALDEGAVAIVAGFQGVAQDTKDITTLGRGRLRHHGGRPGRRAEGGRLRDLHRRGRRLHRRPADRAQRPADHQDHLRGDARARRLRRQGAAPAQRRVRPAGRPADPRPLVVHEPARHHGDRLDGGPSRGASTHHRRRARPQRGEDHDRRRARRARRGGPHLRDGGRRREQHRHDRAERLHRRPPAAPTSRSRCPRPTARPRWPPWPRCRARSASAGWSTTTTSARCRSIGAGMRSHPGVAAKFFARARRGRRQHRDDLHLGDPDLGGVPGHRPRRGRRAVHKAFDLGGDTEAVVYAGTGR